jgi:hypothetical protein
MAGLPSKLVCCCSSTSAPGVLVPDTSLAETIAHVPLTFPIGRRSGI